MVYPVLTNKALIINNQHLNSRENIYIYIYISNTTAFWMYGGYLENNLHLFLATNVRVGESLHMRDSVTKLPCKPSHNWSPIVCSCLLLSDVWCVLRLIVLPAVVYGQNVMREGTVRQWCRMFKDGRTNVYNEDWSGWPSVVSDELVQSVEQKICERQRFTISELLCEFPHTSRTVLYEIITDRSWWKVSKRGWAQCRQTSLTQAYKNLFPDSTRASIQTLGM
jgi:hypothetical protein